MSTSTLQIGKSMTLEAGGMLTVFDVKGAVHSGSWVMNVLTGAFVKVSPAPVSPDIEVCISDDFEAGNGEKIHHIQVSPNAAVRLFLEGKLSHDDVKRADVSTEDLVVFRNISFKIPGGDREFDLHVSPHVHYEFATIDADGNVV